MITTNNIIYSLLTILIFLFTLLFIMCIKGVKETFQVRLPPVVWPYPDLPTGHVTVCEYSHCGPGGYVHVNAPCYNLPRRDIPYGYVEPGSRCR